MFAPGGRRCSLLAIRGGGHNVAPMSYVVMQQMLDAACPYGIHSYWKSNFMRDLPDEAIDTFVEFARSRTSPRTIAVIEHYHGQALRVPPDATAFALRTETLALVILTHWDGGTPSRTSSGPGGSGPP